MKDGNSLLQSVGMHCPNVIELRVTSSDITDEVTAWVAKCPRLELVELHDNKLVTSVGYAQLLRASPKIRLFPFPFEFSPLFDDRSSDLNRSLQESRAMRCPSASALDTVRPSINV